MPLGLLALRAALVATRAEPLALTATVLAWIGSGLVLPYYGAEDFLPQMSAAWPPVTPPGGGSHREDRTETRSG